jgi:starch synthase
MRVLYVSTEVHPALKTGGLADVNAALPRALAAAGVDVRLLLPAFPALLAHATDHGPPCTLGPALGAPAVAVLPCRLNGVPTWLIDAPVYFARAGNPYLDAHGRDWPDNLERFALLAWVATRFADGSVDNWRPDIVHSHDWHAALCPAYLRARGGAGPATVFTVHNLAYQGQFPGPTFAQLGLPAHFFSIHGLEFHGQVNFMKAGLFFADRITTVSPSFAAEIQTPAAGFGMDGLLRSRAGALIGILNGVDTQAWDPRTDKELAAGFDATHLSGRTGCRQALQAELGLVDGDGPLLGVVSRMTPQKGLDLLRACLPQLIAAGGRLALLGSGDADEEAAWRTLAHAHPGTIAVHVGYDEALAHRIFAGVDVVAVPSRFEPCGLTQMYAMLYGALPLVRRTGGLADTVRDASPQRLADGSATGFVFDAADSVDLRAALARVLALWRDPTAWQRVQRTAMHSDFGWARPAARYRALYRELRPQA